VLRHAAVFVAVSVSRAARITRKWCEREGLPYSSMPYVAALADSVDFIGTAWRRPAQIVA